MRGTVSGNVGKVYKAEYVGQYFLLSFSVAESVYQGAGKEKITCWHKCDFWGKNAEGIAQYVTVGQHIDVFGQAYLQEYEKDGVVYKNMVVKVQEVILAPKPVSTPSVGQAPMQPQAPPPAQPPSQQPPQRTGPINYDPPKDIW